MGLRGDKNQNWRGGRTKHTRGYIYLHRPEHPNVKANGYIFEHRLVMEAAIGRYLTASEIVHHINHIKDDNRLENLEPLSSGAEHRERHTIPITPDDKVWIIENWTKLTAVNISKKFGISTQRLKKIGQSLNLPPRDVENIWDKANLLRLYQSGASLRQLALIFNVSHIAVRNRLISLGVQRRIDPQPKNRLASLMGI
jgi:hypothetical protein